MQQQLASIQFGWTVVADQHAQSGARIPGLVGSRILEGPPWPDVDLADVLRSVGLHRDQEDVEVVRVLLRMDGELDPRALGEAVERRAHEAQTGLVVDLRFGFFEIAEHPSVGRGTIVLVDGTGARLLSGRQGATIAEVIATAADAAA
jgi:hypothetical protein